MCQVRTDLHSLGYRTRAVQISARDAGAPHRRERIFVLAVANAHGERCKGERVGDLLDSERASRGNDADRCSGEDGRGMAHPDSSELRLESWGSRGESGPAAAQSGESRAVGLADPNRARLEGRGEPIAACAHERTTWEGRTARSDHEEGRGAQSGMGGGSHGLPAGVDRWPAPHRWPAPRGVGQYAWEPPRAIEGRMIGRKDRLKALGNAVVPQCAYVATMVLAEWARSEERSA